MLFQMRCYWPKSIGWSIGKYRTEYRELNLLFLNHNFSILPDTRIGPYRGVSPYRAISDTSTAPILKYRWFIDHLCLKFYMWCLSSIDPGGGSILAVCVVWIPTSYILAAFVGYWWLLVACEPVYGLYIVPPCLFCFSQISTSFIAINLTIYYFLL